MPQRIQKIGEKFEKSVLYVKEPTRSIFKMYVKPVVSPP